MYALSAFGSRSGRMSPGAVVLATALHGLVALAVWWIAQHPPRLPASEEPVDIVFEEPKPPAQPPPPPKAEAPPKPKPPAAEPMVDMPPPAAVTADKPSQAAPKAKETSPGQPAEAMSREAPPLEQEVPPPPEPPPSPTDNAFVVPKPPPQPQLPHPPLAKPSPPSQQLGTRPSPLSPSPQNKPAASSKAEEPPASAFVNPADTYNRARVSDNYRWQIVRKLSTYVYYATAPVTTGTTVIRVVIARDGRVVEASIVRSCGYPELDQGALTGVRSGSPYPPLPAEIKGESAVFMLPLMSTPVR